MDPRAPRREARAGSRTPAANRLERTFAGRRCTREIVFNCTPGTVSLDALKGSRAQNLQGKILVDVSNPLDFSKGCRLRFQFAYRSIGEQIQRAFPPRRCQSLNTVPSR